MDDKSMQSIDNVINYVHNASDYRKLAVYLNQISTNVLASNLNSGQSPISVLDPHLHTLAYIYITLARITTETVHNSEEIWTCLTSIFTQQNPEQTLFAVEKFESLAELLSAFGRTTNSSKRANDLLLVASSSLSTAPQNLHVLKHIILKHCILAGLKDEAWEILSTSIVGFDTNFGVKCRHHLMYTYDASVLCIQSKRYLEAFRYLKQIVTCPGTACSKIQVAAYKKLCLVSLILHGKDIFAGSLPDCVSLAVNALARNYIRYIRWYSNSWTSREGIATDVKQFSLDEFRNLVRSDRNEGLFLQSLHELLFWKIRKAAQIYDCLKIRDFLTDSGLLKMTTLDLLNCTNALVRQVDGLELFDSLRICVDGDFMIFTDLKEPSKVVPASLNEKLMQVENIKRRLQECDFSLAVSDDYQTKLDLSMKSGKNSTGKLSTGLKRGDHHSLGMSSPFS